MPHPDSDHLHLCVVDVGNQTLHIVCGAPNVAAGQKVIVAVDGCQLPGGVIKSGSVRGQVSQGMICALFELGVDKKLLTPEQLAGIEVLPQDAVVGNTEVLKYLKLDDTILDVSLTPNRADCLSWWAMAKEVGAIVNKPASLPDYQQDIEGDPATLTVDSKTSQCPLFLGRVINHVTIKPSPAWLAEALQAAGIKVINNVVDISNYVMLETGQPLHFYDISKMKARQITVVDGLKEEYEALDGLKYDIQPSDIMITSAGQTIGIAGIMGGEDSKIDENTTGIIIEAANFSSAAIRSTARRLNLETEACQHFEKGIEPLGPQKAVQRSTQLLIELADATGVEQVVKYGSENYQPLTITLTQAQVNDVLATTFTMPEIIEPLQRLDFKPESVDAHTVKCTIPSYRTDVVLPIDLIEEIIRLRGYDNIVSSLPVMPTIQATYAKNETTIRMMKRQLNGWGFSEVVTYSLTTPESDAKGFMSCGTPVVLANPASEQRKIYRTSLMPSLLETVDYNNAHSIDEIAIFEVSNVYNNDNVQNCHLAIAQTGSTVLSAWQKNTATNNFYSMKGYILAILDRMGYDKRRIVFEPGPKDAVLLHPGQCATVSIDRHQIGIIGALNPVYASNNGLPELMMAEINLDAVLSNQPAKIKYTAVGRYPAVKYDLALGVDQKITAEQIIATIRKAGGRLLKETEIFDVYQGAGILPGEKSVAVSVTYQSAEKTLTDKDIDPVHNAILDALQHQLKAVLRSTK